MKHYDKFVLKFRFKSKINGMWNLIWNATFRPQCGRPSLLGGLCSHALLATIITIQLQLEWKDPDIWEHVIKSGP